MKKHNTLLVVFFTILFVCLLTWILPITYLNGEFMSDVRHPIGINELFSYPVYTFYNFIYILVYLLVIGGFYGVLAKTGAYRLIVDKIVKFVKGKEILFLIPTVLIIGLIVSFTGFTFEALIFLPMLASVIFLLGYDKITVAMTTIGSIAVGIIGTTFSSIVAGTFNSILGIEYQELWLVKLLLLVMSAVILIVNIVLHNRDKEPSSKIEENIFIPEKVREKYIRIWPLAVILGVTFVILIMSTIAYKEAFGINFFDTSLQSLLAYRILDKYIVLGVSLIVVLYNVIRYVLKRKSLKKDKKEESFIKIFGKLRLIITGIFAIIFVIVLSKLLLEDVFKVTTIFTKVLSTIKLDSFINWFTFSRILGGVGAFGTWTYNEYITLLLVVTFIIKFVYSVELDELFDGYLEGSRKFASATMIALLSYTVLIMVSNHPVVLTALKPLLLLTDGLNNLTLSLSTFVAALFNTDFTYYQYGVLTLNYVTAYITDTSVYPLCAIITQSMYGLAILVAPTSVVMLFSLTTLKISYFEWLKNIWKLFVELLVVLLITFMIILLVI